MLALTRKVGDSIMIGDDIEIFIMHTSGDQVRLAIKAPKEVSIHRREVYDQILNENKSAVNSNLENLNKLKNIIKK